MIHGSDTDAVTLGVLEAVSAAGDFPIGVLAPYQSLSADLDFDAAMLADLADRLARTWPSLPAFDGSALRPESTIDDLISWARRALAPSAWVV